MKDHTHFPETQNSRRQFLKNAGGAIFYITASFAFPSLQSCSDGKSQENPTRNGTDLEYEGQEVNVWVQIHENGKITIFNPSSEMGQGSMTALAVILAEELDADWSNIHIEQAPAEPEIYGSPGWRDKTMITVGSRTVMSYYDSLRQAGAQARYVLLSNVADHWEVPITELSTEPHTVIHKKTNKRISYGEIASFIKPLNEVPEISKEQLKNPADFRLIGKIASRFDIPAKVNGSAKYAIDIQIPGMAYGVISRSPVNGASPQLLNEQAIRDMTDVLDIIPLEHGIGVIASSIEGALKAKNKLNIGWSEGERAENHTSEEAYAEYEKIAENRNADHTTIVNEGNIEKAMQTGSKTYHSDYKNDYVYHAQMEPLNAVVSVAEDNSSAEVWVGTQAPASARSNVADVLGIDFSRVKIHRQYLGGGFGRRSNSDYVREAAYLAKESGHPVKLIWTREDDIQYGMFRPMSLQRMKASVGESGQVTGWQHIIVGTGGRLLGSGAETQFYTFPNQKIEVWDINHGIRTKHWRAVGHGPNKFAIEAFIDEIAADQGADPFDFRMKLMKNYPRAQNVLQTVAEMADWKSNPQENRAKGIAFAERSSSLAACVCEISLNRENGKIRVHNIWASLDAGVVIQPDNAIAQMEGALLMGMGSVLKERISFVKGKVQQSNYHDYSILRMNEVPDNIEVKIIPSKERPTGIGESGIPIIGGAIANAFARLTGKRIRHMPFTAERVVALLKS